MGNVYTNPPQSRNEAILRATIDGTEYEAPPQSRMEDLLVELKAAIEQGGGIGSYNDLNNKPKINSVTLQGDQSISDLFDGKVDIGVGTVEESGYVELKDENGDRIFRASSANGGASVESGALIGQPGALVLYNGEGGVSSVSPKGGVSLVDVDLPAENGTLALDSQIASSQTPAKAAVVTVPDASPINAEDITVDITPQQDLHGFDRPWAGGAGKNKLNTNIFNDTTYFTVNSNGSVTQKLDDNRGEGSMTALHMAAGEYIISRGTSIGSMRVYANISGTWTTFVNTSSENATFTLSVDCDLYIKISVSGTYPNTFYPMIRLATETDATFAPYSNECPIEGWTGAELDRVGVNQWDEEWELGNINDIGDTTSSSYHFRSKNYISCKPSTRYYLKDGSLAVARIFYYDKNQQFISFIVNPYNAEFETPSNCYYLKFRTKDDFTTYNNDISINYPATDTSYHPYQGKQYTADFGETVYGGKWHVTEGGTDKTHGNIANYNGETINEPWLSSMDEYSPGVTPTTGAQVVYPLTTPTTISTPKQNVPMLQGINTVSANCGDTQLKYQPDNVIGELKGMIQALDARVTALEEAE